MSINRIQAIVTTSAEAGNLQKQIEAFIAQARMMADGGLTLAEIGQIFTALITLGVYAAKDLADATGEEKKAAVLDAVGYLFDVLAPAFPLPWFLQPFRAWLRSPMRSIVLAIADGILEATVAKMKLEK
jgi:ABC-type Co2+ transport system permease subunit